MGVLHTINNNHKGSPTTAYGRQCWEGLLEDLYMVDNASRGFADNVKVNNYGKPTDPLYTILMHWRCYKGLEGNYFLISFILFVCFLYFLLLILLEWPIIGMVGMSLNDRPYLLFFSLYKLFTINWIVVVNLVSDCGFYWKLKEVEFVPLAIPSQGR